MAKLSKDTYLAHKIAQEVQSLERVAKNDPVHRYILTRSELADFAQPRIAGAMESREEPKILELGCGVGNVLQKIADNNPQLPTDNLYGTALNLLPQHESLRERGIHLFTQVVAEFLPQAWQGMFDMVLASVVMRWTEVGVAVPEISRVLKPSGYFIGFDDIGYVRKVHNFASQHGLRYDYTTSDEQLWHRVGREGYPFVFQKVG